MSVRQDERSEELSNKAFAAGKEFAKQHPFAEFKDDRDSGRLMDHCPFHLSRFGDVFKYGCQSVWRRNGELPNMVALDLEPGDIFKVDKPDPESDVRVCLTNDKENGLRFGFPNKPDYWCYMGKACLVTIVEKGGDNEA
jgi:hypothetical protein